jgi:hypothetical protein
MSRGRKAAVAMTGVLVAVAVVAAVYFFLPTAPKTIEGTWVSEDGLVIGTYEGGTARQFMEATYGGSSTPDQTFKYAITGDMMRMSDGRESDGKDVLLPPMTLALRFSFGNRVVTMYDGGQRVSSLCRAGSPEARLLHFSNNWYR